MGAVGGSLSREPIRCSQPGCSGILVRHSLGNGLSTHRCIECIKRASKVARASTATPSLPRGFYPDYSNSVSS
jgi:hypothetical protein